MNEVVPARKSGVYAIDVADEVVVYDRVADRAHRLNRTAAAVWRRCDGRSSPSDLASVLGDELGGQASEDLVWLAIAELSDAGLLADDIDANGVGRRDALKRLGAAGAAVLVLPIVSSIIAPTPAMADSASSTGANDADDGGNCPTAHERGCGYYGGNG